MPGLMMHSDKIDRIYADFMAFDMEQVMAGPKYHELACRANPDGSINFSETKSIQTKEGITVKTMQGSVDKDGKDWGIVSTTPISKGVAGSRTSEGSHLEGDLEKKYPNSLEANRAVRKTINECKRQLAPKHP